MQPRGGQHMCLEAAEQRHQRRGGGTHLVGQSGEAERHALVSSDFVNCPPWRHEELTPSLVGSVRLWFERRAGLLQKASPALLAEPIRSEERRVGKECAMPFRSRGSPYDSKKKKTNITP